MNQILDRDAPWSWSRGNVLGLLTDRQRRYVELVGEVFRIKTANGNVVRYDPEPYQVWFHAHSPLAMGTDAPDRLVEKGRGLGLTLMTAMDLLLLAHQQQRIHIPVAGRQSSTGDEFVQKTHDLVADCAIEGFFDPDPTVTSMVRLGNWSTIEPVPGGNPAAIRSKRAPAACFDEYAFHPKARDIWRAGRAVLSEGGQLTVLSTHDGAGTHFYQLVEASRNGELDFTLFSFPTHDPVQYDAGRPVPDQLASGKLRLIAPWIDVDGLEKMRREDPYGYAQEHLCQVMDEKVNLLSRGVVDAAHDPMLPSWEGLVRLEESPRLAQLVPPIRVPRRPPRRLDPVYVGVDFASQQDLSAYTALEATPEGLAQRWLAKLEGVPTPQQNELLRLVVRLLHPAAVVIDMTGAGTGLYEYAVDELAKLTSVVGVHFGAQYEVGGGPHREKVPVKKAMALHLAVLMQEGRLRLLGGHDLTPLQKRHLLAIRRSDLDAPRKAGEGHADIFWAVALAAHGQRVEADTPVGGVLRPSWHPGHRDPEGKGGVIDSGSGGVLRPSWRRHR